MFRLPGSWPQAVRAQGGWPRTRLAATLAAGLLAISATVAIGGHALVGGASPAGPTLSARPNAVAPATTITAVGDGFPAFSVFQLTWDGVPAGMPMTISSPTGAFRVGLRVPSNASGVHTIGVKSAGYASLAISSARLSTGSATTTVTVNGPNRSVVAPSNPSTATSPTQAPVSFRLPLPRVVPAPSATPKPTGTVAAPVATPTPTPGRQQSRLRHLDPHRPRRRPRRHPRRPPQYRRQRQPPVRRRRPPQRRRQRQPRPRHPLPLQRQSRPHSDRSPGVRWRRRAGVDRRDRRQRRLGGAARLHRHSARRLDHPVQSRRDLSRRHCAPIWRAGRT